MEKLDVFYPDLLKVFVYGTLKPGECNYNRYCSSKVIDAVDAIAKGKLFALPMGYPAMALGHYSVRGYLLAFADSKVLTELDQLEDYHPKRADSENLYNRLQIEVHDLQGHSLGWAWVYLMKEELATQLGGVFLPDGWWTEL